MTVNAVNTYIVPTVAREVTMPSQPAFLGVGAVAANVTGNGTLYTLGTAGAYTQEFDQNADFNVNGTFTAPVTGRYRLDSYIAVDDPNGATDGRTEIVTSNHTYITGEFNPNILLNTGGGAGFSASVLGDMDAADTAVLTIDYNGAGADNVDIRGSYFSGSLEV